jgi:uncharacterized protein YtpQ (UPF0354 family)
LLGGTIIVIGSSAFRSAAGAAKTMSPEHFTSRLAAYMNASKVNLSATIRDVLMLDLSLNGAAPSEVNLSNAYRMHLEAPEDVDGLFNHLTIGFSSMLTPPKLNKSDLLPVVRAANWMPRHAIAQQRLNDDLSIFYVFDLPHANHFAKDADLELLGIAPKDRLAAALANLHDRATDLNRRDEPSHSVLMSNDSFLTSMLLVDEAWDPAYSNFKGKIGVFVPARNVIIITGTEETEGLVASRKTADQMYHELPHPISPKLFVRDENQWVTSE